MPPIKKKTRYKIICTYMCVIEARKEYSISKSTGYNFNGWDTLGNTIFSKLSP